MNTKHDCNILDSKLVTVASDYGIRDLKCDSKNGMAVTPNDEQTSGASGGVYD
jgi:hypothetical protein